MAYWDGRKWAPEASTGAVTLSRGHRLLGSVTEALLVAAIIGVVVMVGSPVYGPARFAAGTGAAAAAGKQVYTLVSAGARVWQEPYAYADFVITRAKADQTDAWVKAHCVDSTGAQAIPGADPYGYVRWDVANPLMGRATLDSVKNGSRCQVWLSRSIRSSGGTAGWPEIDVAMEW